MKKYIRDKRSPTPLNKNVSKVMSANKDINTKPELTVRRALWKDGLRGYRLHWKKIPGRPDIVFPSRKLAIFINGCYWHRCPKCNLPMPKTNVEFWRKKFSRNKERDLKKILELEKLNWRVMTLWECEIKNELEFSLNTIKKLWKSIN